MKYDSLTPDEELDNLTYGNTFFVVTYRYRRYKLLKTVLAVLAHQNRTVCGCVAQW